MLVIGTREKKTFEVDKQTTSIEPVVVGVSNQSLVICHRGSRKDISLVISSLPSMRTHTSMVGRGDSSFVHVRSFRCLGGDAERSVTFASWYRAFVIYDLIL